MSWASFQCADLTQSHTLGMNRFLVSVLQRFTNLNSLSLMLAQRAGHWYLHKRGFIFFLAALPQP